MVEKEYRHIGKSYLRKEGQEKVTGQAMYIHDLELPGMLHAKLLHSPHARAKILSIDTSSKGSSGLRLFRGRCSI